MEALTEAVRAELTAAHARIEACFEQDTDRHYALERAQESIGNALALLDGAALPLCRPSLAEGEF